MLHRLTCIAAVLLTATIALGQGAGKQFPGPLSWPTLRQRLLLISPSAAQSERIAAEHDAYLVEFEALRSGSIASFLDDTKGLGVLTTTKPEEGRRTVARTKHIRSDIAKLDDALFLQLAGILAESQQDGLERIKQRRERDRLQTRASTMITGGNFQAVEPREAIDWAALSQVDRDAIENMLAVWENKYTNHIQTWSRSQDRALIAFVEILSELNAKQAAFSPESPPNPEEIAELISVFQAAQKSVQEQVAPDVRRIQKHIVGGFRSLAAALPEDQQYDVIRTLATDVWMINSIPKAERGARRSGLDDATTEALNQIVLAWEDDAVNLLIEAVEAKWRDSQARQQAAIEPNEDGSVSIALPTAEQVDAVRARWDIKHTATLRAIASLVPSRDADTLIADGSDDGDTQPRKQNEVMAETIVMIESNGDGSEDQVSAISISGSVSESPNDEWNDPRQSLLSIPPIKQLMLESITRNLQLNEVGLAELNALYATHEAARLAMETSRATERRKMAEDAQKKMDEIGQGDQAAMMRLSMLMMEPLSRDGLDELDTTFFTGVNTLARKLGKNPMRVVQPWRLSRTRSLSSSGGGMLTGSLDMIGPPDDRWKADLFEVVETADLTDADRAAAHVAMQDWHAAATSGMADIKKSRDELNEGMQAMMSSGDGGVSIDMTAAMEVEKLQQTMTQSRQSLATRSQQTAEVIAAAIVDSSRFRREWFAAAFPRVATSDRFLKLYGLASNTDELSDDQRAAIAMLRAEHDENWWATTEKAVAVMTAAEKATSDNPQDAFYRSQRLRQEVDRHTFARREAALKRLEKLRAILNEQQIAAAGGLEDPAAPQTLELPF
ncbi:MAG: hypothetical protein P8I91_08255 [Phycisphaerales bacterium]|nr:hypothetical protein [Phycisphaerales bacterium]